MKQASISVGFLKHSKVVKSFLEHGIYIVFQIFLISGETPFSCLVFSVNQASTTVLLPSPDPPVFIESQNRVFL